MRPGVAFPHRHPHEAFHLSPLWDRLRDLLVAPPEEAAVVVQADSRPPVQGAWNVQVFHGLGDKAYTCNPIFLQQGRRPRLRTALNMALGAFRLPMPFLEPPAKPGRRPSRYQQVNAYGKRFEDALRGMLREVEVTRFGHVALNEREGLRVDPEGPVAWMPTWDNRAYMGGEQQSGLDTFAHEVAALAATVPVRVKLHPLTVQHGQSRRARKALEDAPGVTMVPSDRPPYEVLDGCRALLTDTSSLGFEAYACGLPVGIARPPAAARPRGLHAELEERVPRLGPGRPSVARWAQRPEAPGDRAWARDLLESPQRGRNDAFAAQLRQMVVERVSGAAW